jgi:hypothetical protein
MTLGRGVVASRRSGSASVHQGLVPQDVVRKVEYFAALFFDNLVAARVASYISMRNETDFGQCRSVSE